MNGSGFCLGFWFQRGMSVAGVPEYLCKFYVQFYESGQCQNFCVSFMHNSMKQVFINDSRNYSDTTIFSFTFSSLFSGCYI